MAKAWLIRLAILAAFFAAAEAAAAPTYGTAMPRKGKAFVGYEANIVFKHDLSSSHGAIKSAQHFYNISYGVYNWLTLDGRIGVGDTLQKGGVHPKVYYNSGFSGGYGFRVLALDDVDNRVKIAIGFHHISVHGNDRNINGDKYESFLDDWQCSVTASKGIGPLEPFLGVKASKFDLVYKVNEIDRKRRPPQNWFGLVAGCQIKLPHDLSIRVETRFIDESALSMAASWTF